MAGGLNQITAVDNDWNNNVNQGVYSIQGGTYSNMPQNSYDFGMLIVFANKNFVVQIYLTHSSQAYFRLKCIGADIEWNNWSKIQSTRLV